jgi:hypothetical protein
MLGVSAECCQGQAAWRHGATESSGHRCEAGGRSTAPLGACGSFARKNPVFDSTKVYYYDRFGNYYEEEELLLHEAEPAAAGGCGCDEFDDTEVPHLSESYYQLEFADCAVAPGTGFFDPVLGRDRRRVACRAFAYLAHLIKMQADPCAPGQSLQAKVSIRIEAMDTSDPNPNPPFPLAAASGLYDRPALGGILDPVPWKIINNPCYLNHVSADMVHGRVEVNFDEPYYLGDDESAIGANEFDFYTVMQHEGLHLIGFLSLMEAQTGGYYNGLAKSYARFDTRLQLAGGTALVERDANDPYRWVLNPAINLPGDLHGSCTAAPGPTMEFASFFNGETFPIYTGDLDPLSPFYAQGHSPFSHLNEACPGTPDAYLMSPFLAAGERRALGDAERRILCDLGFELPGMPGCACTVAGCDSPAASCPGEALGFTLCGNPETFVISVQHLIGNDIGADGMAFPKLLHLRNGIFLDYSEYLVDNGDGTLSISPCGPGKYYIQYTPVSSACPQEGSTALAIIYFDRCGDCAFLHGGAPPTLSECNMVCNSQVAAETCESASSSQFININCNPDLDLPGWLSATATPDYYEQYPGAPSPGVIYLAGSADNDENESIYTPVNAGAGQYLVSVYSRNQSPLNFYLEIYFVDQGIVSQFGNCETAASGLPDIDFQQGASSRFTLETATSVSAFTRSARCLELPEGSEYTALWIHPMFSPPASAGYRVWLDHIELVPDDFELGGDLASDGCGLSLGGIFCMLSDVAVHYEWFEDLGQGPVLIASYQVLNGTAAVLSGNIGPLTHQLSVAPQATATYSLRRSVASPSNLPSGFELCKEPDEIVVHVGPFVPPVFNLLSSGCMDAVFEITGLNSGHVWQIDYGDGTQGTSLEHAYPEPGIYQALLRVEDACGNSAEVPLGVPIACFECDDCPGNTIGTPGQATLLSTLLAAGTVPPSGTPFEVCVEGVLVIDQPYNLQNSLLLMQPGAKVEVLEGATLAAAHSSLIGCDAMWRGIELMRGSGLKMGACTVADAQYALYAHPSAQAGQPLSSIGVSSSLFDNNFVGFYVPPTGSGQLNAAVSGNTFAQSAEALKPPFPGQASGPEDLPNQAGLALAGIVLNDLGGFNSLSNHFSAGLAAGIVSYNSTLSVRQNTFSGIGSGEGAYPSFGPRGAGVWSSSEAGDILLVDGSSFAAGPRGILAHGCRLRASDNFFSSLEWGIGAALGLPGQIQIADNRFEGMARFGALLQHSHPLGKLTVRDNEIQTDSDDSGGGIVVLFSRATLDLRGNRVTVSGQGTGIGLHSFLLGQGQLVENIIELEDPQQATAGIGLWGAYNCLLRKNTVTGSGTAGPGNIALSINGSSGNVYCCNSFDDTRIGAYVTGSSLATDNFRGNTFGSHDISLHLMGTDAILGTQTHTQNCWGADAGPALYGADAQDPVPVEFAQEYPFTVDPDDMPCFMPEDHFPMGWFRDETDVDHADACDVEACMLDMFAPESEDVKRIALGDTVVAPAVMWELQRHVYGRLQGEIVHDASIIAFLAQADTSSIGAFHSLSQDISALLAVDSAALAQLRAKLEAAEGKLDSLRLIDGSLPGADSAQAAALWGEKAALTGALHGLAEENRGMASHWLGYISGEAGKLRSQNDSIAARAIYEANEKEVNDIYLSWLGAAFGALGSIEMAALQAIALQCPIEGGNAVYRARAFLAILAWEYADYDDSLLCAPLGLLAAPPQAGALFQAANEDKVFRIYPNPAQNEIGIALNAPEDAPGLLLVYDIFGRQLLQHTLAAGADAYSLSIGELPEGLYIFRLRFQDWDAIRKIVISR